MSLVLVVLTEVMGDYALPFDSNGVLIGKILLGASVYFSYLFFFAKHDLNSVFSLLKTKRVG
jgi:hypothetical protein